MKRVVNNNYKTDRNISNTINITYLITLQNQSLLYIIWYKELRDTKNSGVQRAQGYKELRGTKNSGGQRAQGYK